MEGVMRRFVAFSIFMFAGLFGVWRVATAQDIAAVPEIPYTSVKDFPSLPPNVYFGEVAGVAVNSKGARVRFLARQ
jgi:hypothetical protein